MGPNSSPRTIMSCGRRPRSWISALSTYRRLSLLSVRPISMCLMSLVMPGWARPASRERARDSSITLPTPRIPARAPCGHALLQCGDLRLGRVRPFGDEVDLAPVQAVVDDLDVEAGGHEPVAQRLGGGAELRLLHRRGAAALQQPWPVGAHHVDLGATGEEEEEPALDVGAGAQLPVDVGDVGAAHDGDVDAESAETFHAAADGRGVRLAVGHGRPVPIEAEDRELAVQRLAYVVARGHVGTILPHPPTSCTTSRYTGRAGRGRRLGTGPA